MWKEFRDFALRGNVVDMAIGILIGLAFNPIVHSLVDDVIMPPIGLLLGNVDFSNLFLVLKEGAQAGPYASLQAAAAAGAVTVNYGKFLNTIWSFLIIAFVAFWIVKGMNELRRREQGAAPSEPTTKSCPECMSTIPVKATRCPFCTQALGAPT